MLDKTGTRQLCYVTKIDWVKPIEGADSIELIGIGGWTCIAKIGEFQPGSKAVYFEIDSKLPETEWSEFLAPKHYKVKTMKLGKFGVVSQGLALPFSAFGWDENKYEVGTFLTKELKVRYSVEEDNKRKANSNPDAKINAALARHPKIAKKYGKLIKKNKFLRFVFVFIFGKKNDARKWPAEVRKTDEERIENRIWTLEDSDKKWIATEKIDGSSSTYHLRRAHGLSKPEFFICSRNVVFDKPDRNNYYSDKIEGNMWIQMAEKYDIQNVLQQLLNTHPTANWVTLQGETFGKNVQKREYGLKGQDFRAFNLIFSDKGRLNTLDMKAELEAFNIPCVPVVDKSYTLPKTIDELREFVHSQKSEIDGGMREGIVFRSMDGTDSFKCVDPAYLLKYHG